MVAVDCWEYIGEQMIDLQLPPNEQLKLTLYPVLRLAFAKPQPSVKRNLTPC